MLLILQSCTGVKIYVKQSVTGSSVHNLNDSKPIVSKWLADGTWFCQKPKYINKGGLIYLISFFHVFVGMVEVLKENK